MSSKERRPRAAWSRPESPSSSRSLVPLSRDLSHSIFILNGYFEKNRRMEGPSYHRLIGEWIGTGKTTEADIFDWLSEKDRSGPVNRRRFDHARRQADQWQSKGIRVFACSAELSTQGGCGPYSRNPPDGKTEGKRDGQTDGNTPTEEMDYALPLSCPRVLYGTGSTQWDRARIAFFNSRKPRLVSPHDEWLEALRSVLHRLLPPQPAFAGSIGTLTYDMLTAHAQREGFPLLLVTSDVAEDFIGPAGFPFDAGDDIPISVLTCRTRAVRCPKPVCMVCRDRILASMADVHVVLETRSGGNLVNVLLAQQDRQPRHQLIYRPKKRRPENEGNFALLAGYPKWAEVFSREDPGLAHKEAGSDLIPCLVPDNSSLQAGSAAVEPPQITWRDYLYHYTRSCPDSWPGQSYRDYLLALLDGDPLSGHTALDTLIRILTEKLIRAGSKLVRGEEPVVSWTSRPPLELDRLRRWNPALIRWTFEPFGVAIKREELRKRSIKPTIYAREKAYGRLHPADRFRFQRHEPPKCSWIHEREWRLPADLLLSEIPLEEGFAFVADGKDRKKLESVSERLSFPVVALSDLR